MVRFSLSDNTETPGVPFGLRSDVNKARETRGSLVGSRLVEPEDLSGFAASEASPRRSEASLSFTTPSDVSAAAYSGTAPWHVSNTTATATTTPLSATTPPSSRPSRTTNSVRLTTAVPDGKVLYSLTGSPGFYSISMQEISADDKQPTDTPLEKIPLPSFAQESLRIDPPLELLCLEGDGFDSSIIHHSIKHNNNDNNNDSPHAQPYPTSPRLLIYSSKAIFLCQTMHNNTCHCTPLLQTLLLECGATKIVRIRPAPQRFRGHAYYAPAGSFAILLADNYEGTLYRFLTVDAKGKHRTAAEIKLEALAEHCNRIVDFDFGKSQGPLALLSSIAVYCLHASGDVGCLSPVVWHGSLVSKLGYDTALLTLKAHAEKQTRGTPIRKQALAAQRYLVEVFSKGTVKNNHTGTLASSQTPSAHRNHFVQADLHATEASQWPPAYQSTVLLASAQEYYSDTVDDDEDANAGILTDTARTLDCVAAGDWAGLVVGRAQAGCLVEWGITSPKAILPLFFMNNFQDCLQIGDLVCRMSQWIDRVHLALPTSSGSRHHSRDTTASMAIIPDAISETLFHVIIPRGVYTISTNVLFVAGKQLQQTVDEYTEVPPKRSTAWATLQTTAADSIRGVAVWSLPHFGHGMSVRLANSDAMTNIHVSHHQYLHEMENFFKEKQSPQPLLTNGPTSALEELEKTPPFYETIKPLVEKIQGGLAKMSMIAGSATSCNDMTPDHMAVAIEIKKQCEEDIYLPLLELVEVTRRRKKALRTVIASQKSQLEALLQEKDELKAGRDRMRERLETAAANMHILADRSAYVREALASIGPSMTLAESDFCDYMARVNASLTHLESNAQSLVGKMEASLPTDLADGFRSIHTQEQWEQVAKLQSGTKIILEKSRDRLHKADTTLRQLASKTK